MTVVNPQCLDTQFGYARPGITTFNVGYTYIGYETSISTAMHAVMYFSGITIPAGATIDAAYLSINGYGSTGTPSNVVGRIQAVNAQTPTFPSNYTQFNALSKTAEYVDWSPASWGTGWNNTSSIISLVEALLASYSYSSGIMEFVITAQNTGNDRVRGEDSGGSLNPKLYIEYTEAASGKPAAQVIWI